MTLNEMGQECHQIAVEHGFWPESRSWPYDKEQYTFNGADLMVGVKLALIHSEVSEALEEYRVKRDEQENIRNLGCELVDAIVRIVELCHYLGFDMDNAYAGIVGNNRNRPYRHSKRF